MKSNENILLKSNILVVNRIIKKTRAKMFKNLKVGDEIQLSVEVAYAGRNGGTHATYILIENLRTGEFTAKSFNEISIILDNFELIEKE